jgi:hypothetical protein
VLLQAPAAHDELAEPAAKALRKEREQHEKLARKVHCRWSRFCRLFYVVSQEPHCVFPSP